MEKIPKKNINMSFTYEEYKKIIYSVKKNGFEISNYENIDKHLKAVIFRHDIDFSPSKALKIAEIENNLSIKSIYFVLLSTNFYNVFSLENQTIFKRIISLGHEIGLHFDETKYVYLKSNDIKKFVNEEAETLGRALGVNIKTVSMHRPSKNTLENNYVFNNLINAYSFKYLYDIKYISDSRMNWKQNPFELLENIETKKVQILTHPFWFDEEVLTVKEKLMNFIEISRNERFKFMKNNFTDIEEYIDSFNENYYE
jgi:hypothetical protein